MLDAVHVHLLVLGGPAPQLTLDVAVVAGQFPKTRALDVDVVKLGQGGGEIAHLGAECDLLGAEAVGLGFGILPCHSRASLLDAWGLGVMPALRRKARPSHTEALLDS